MNSIPEVAVTYLTNTLWMTCVIAAVTALLSRASRRCPLRIESFHFSVSRPESSSTLSPSVPLPA
jgi:hypothetical protein